jgi:hypothetical protein
MNRTKIIALCLSIFCVLAGTLAARNRGVIDTSESPYVKLRSLDLDAVNWTANFWGDRFNLVRQVGLPRLWEAMQDPQNSANMVNLRIAAGLAQGKFEWEPSGLLVAGGEQEDFRFSFATTPKPLGKPSEKIRTVFARVPNATDLEPDGALHSQTLAAVFGRSPSRFCPGRLAHQLLK